MMKHIFIINPVAGKGKMQQGIIQSIHEVFKGGTADYEIYVTRFKGDGERYVKDMCEKNIECVFYACGGDGTLHEVVKGAVNYSHVSVGHIPCGSGNDFVKNFENTGNFSLIEAQLQGKATFIDLIKVGDEYAASVCNVGLDADAAFNMHKFKKIPFISGTTCYILSVLYCLLKPLGKEFEMEFDDGQSVRGKFLLGVVANGHSYGGGYKCAPQAKINDGILDICLVRNISRFKILDVINSYKAGTHLENEKINSYIKYVKSKRVKIKSSRPLNLCIDGESFIYDEAEFEVLKGGLKFWVPKGSAVISDGVAVEIE